MKAITVKYISPGNVKGARLKAFDSDNNSVTIPYPHDLDGDAKYRRAAQALCDKMGWKGSMVSGGTKDGEVFVFSPCLDACRAALAVLDGSQPKDPAGAIMVLRSAIKSAS